MRLCAGKTTTLALLTGRAHASSGDALVNGVSVMGEAEPASRALLGFCPQQDPLLELLTAREHLSLYARLKARPAPQSTLRCTPDHTAVENLRGVRTPPDADRLQPRRLYTVWTARRIRCISVAVLD